MSACTNLSTALDPWYFPSADEYAALLGERGFRVEAIACFPRPTPLPTGIRGWLETFAASFSSPLPPASRPAFIDEVSELLAPDGSFVADYMRLRFATRRTSHRRHTPHEPQAPEAPHVKA